MLVTPSGHSHRADESGDAAGSRSLCRGRVEGRASSGWRPPCSGHDGQVGSRPRPQSRICTSIWTASAMEVVISVSLPFSGNCSVGPEVGCKARESPRPSNPRASHTGDCGCKPTSWTTAPIPAFGSIHSDTPTRTPAVAAASPTGLWPHDWRCSISDMDPSIPPVGAAHRRRLSDTRAHRLIRQRPGARQAAVRRRSEARDSRHERAR